MEKRELMAMNETQPPRIKPLLKAAPRIRQVLWCNFPKDAQLPEFWKVRPILVISKRSNLHGHVTVLPFSTKSQSDNPAAYPVVSPVDGKKTWIICNYITTVSVSRLMQSNVGFSRLPENDFDKVVNLMLQYLPRPQS